MDDLKIDKENVASIVTALELLASKLRDSKVGDITSNPEDMEDMFRKAREEARKRDVILDFIKQMSEEVASRVVNKINENQTELVENEDGVYVAREAEEQSGFRSTAELETGQALRLETKTPSIIPPDTIATHEIVPVVTSDTPESKTTNDPPAATPDVIILPPPDVEKYELALTAPPSEPEKYELATVMPPRDRSDGENAFVLIDTTQTQQKTPPAIVEQRDRDATDIVPIETNESRVDIIPDTIHVTVADIDDDALMKVSKSIAKAITKAEFEMARRRRRGFGTSDVTTPGAGGILDQILGGSGVNLGVLPVGSGSTKTKGKLPKRGFGLPKMRGGLFGGLGKLGILGSLISAVSVFDTYMDESLSEAEKLREYYGIGGSLAGGLAGGKLGVMLGSILGPPGQFIGGLIGAIAGAVFGEKAAEGISDYMSKPGGLRKDVEGVSNKISDWWTGQDTELTAETQGKAFELKEREVEAFTKNNPKYRGYISRPEAQKEMTPEEFTEYNKRMKEAMVMAKAEARETGIPESVILSGIKGGLRTTQRTGPEAVKELKQQVEDDYERMETYMYNMVMSPGDADLYENDRLTINNRPGEKITKEQIVEEMRADIQHVMQMNTDKMTDDQKQLYETMSRLKLPEESSNNFAKRMSELMGSKVEGKYISDGELNTFNVPLDVLGELYEKDIDKESRRRIDMNMNFDEDWANRWFKTRFDVGLETIGDESMLRLTDLEKLMIQSETDETAKARVDQVFVDMERMKEVAKDSDDMLSRARYQGFVDSELGKYMLRYADLQRRMKENPDAFKPATDRQKTKTLETKSQKLLDKIESQQAPITPEQRDEIKNISDQSNRITIEGKSENIQNIQLFDQQIKQEEARAKTSAARYEPFKLIPTQEDQTATVKPPVNRLAPFQEKKPQVDPRVQEIIQQQIKQFESKETKTIKNEQLPVLDLSPKPDEKPTATIPDVSVAPVNETGAKVDEFTLWIERSQEAQAQAINVENKKSEETLGKISETLIKIEQKTEAPVRDASTGKDVPLGPTTYNNNNVNVSPMTHQHADHSPHDHREKFRQR